MISKIGRRRWNVRFVLAAISGLLILGSVTMIYPFALMLAGSTKSNADNSENRIIPGFLVNRDTLWAKTVEGIFNESLLQMRSTYRNDANSFETTPPPKHLSHALAEEWLAFLKKTNPPPTWYTVAFLEAPNSKNVLPQALRKFRDELNRRFDGDLSRLNETMQTDFPLWNSLTVQSPVHLLRRQTPSQLPMALAIDRFSADQPIEQRTYFYLEGFYVEQFLRPQYPKIEDYNAHHHTHYVSFADLRLSQRLPGEGHTDAERKTWEDFVRSTLNLMWVRADQSAAPLYRQYLQAKYGTIEDLNRIYQTTYPNFDAIPLIQEPPTGGIAGSDWEAFIVGWQNANGGKIYAIPASALRIHGIDFLFQDALRDKYHSIGAMNAALGTSFAAFADIIPPQETVHYNYFLNHIASLRWEFVVRNYISVIDYMAIHGHAIWNTFIYCALAVAGALIVNPLAAYALSRYRPPSTYKILMILMLTMAFPPMVTQIPVFLMLRDLHLLNTFWALVLPGLASGYMIFLLKGFFDSLPQELYESATLDGAGEIRIFLQITMSLSKPILAVVALGAFTTAYSNFIFALLICQDPNMWTLTVWLFQLQSVAGPGVVLASVTLAALPTFVVFVACQQVIMQGIVVPVEK